MKRSLLIICILFIAIGGLFSQNNLTNCALPNNKFLQKLEMLRSFNNENQRLAKAKDLARDFCLTSQQVKEVAEIFVNDYNRLDFAQAAFVNVTDKENFYDVYDSFAYFSNVFRLHDFVTHTETHTQTPPPPPPPPAITFPPLNYPNPVGYMGPSGCHPPLSNNDFMILVGQIFDQPSEAGKMMIADQMALNNCLSTEQAMKMASLLQLESNRLVFLKNAYPHVYDLKNYGSAAQLLSHPPYRKALKEYIEDYKVPGTPPPPPPCSVSDDDMSQVLESIKKQSFDNTKQTIAKQIITAKKCFTVDQIKSIMKCFSFEDSKLAMAKFAYDFCLDKRNYYQVNDLFSFSATVSELDKYISTKH